jgi:hypothetical protein
MIRQRITHSLENCLNRLDKGESLQEVLETYPAQADRLKKLLGLAMVSRALPKPVPSKAAERVGKNYLLESMHILQYANAFRKMDPHPVSRQGRESWLSRTLSPISVKILQLKPVYRLAMIGLVLILAGSFFTINASASSLPGDTLYDLKLGLEQVQMFFTFDDEAKQELALTFERERLFEVKALLAEGRSEYVDFSVIVDKANKSNRIISGIAVQVDPEINLDDNLEEGTKVEVAAVTQEDGTLLALKVSDATDGFDLGMIDTAEDDLDDEKDKDKEEKEEDKEEKEEDKDKDKEDKDKDKEDKDKDKEDKDKDKDK